jgi:hypothetical protein
VSVKELEQAIAGLPEAEFAALADWFDQFRSAERDRRIEADAAAGRSDTAGRRALRQHIHQRSDRRGRQGNSIRLAIDPEVQVGIRATRKFFRGLYRQRPGAIIQCDSRV